MKNIGKISIILPCYKAERYVGGMIGDILAQTYKDWQLIVVSNGAGQEAQLKVINAYAEKDNRIEVVTVEQGGVSNARNIGIKKAKGEWLCFVDADDRLKNCHLQRFTDAIDKNSEVIEGGFIQVDRNHHISERLLCNEKINLSEAKFTELYLSTSDKIVNAPWQTLFKIDFLRNKNILFDTQFTMYEDWIFKQKAYLQANRWQFIPMTGYIYMVSSGSAMSKWHANTEDSWNEYLDTKDEVKKRSGFDQQRIKAERTAMQYHVVWHYIWNMFKPGCPLSFKEKLKKIAAYMQEDDFKESCKVHDWSKDNIYYKLFHLCVRLHSPFIVACLFWSQHNVKQVINKMRR